MQFLRLAESLRIAESMSFWEGLESTILEACGINKKKALSILYFFMNVKERVLAP